MIVVVALVVVLTFDAIPDTELGSVMVAFAAAAVVPELPLDPKTMAAINPPNANNPNNPNRSGLQHVDPLRGGGGGGATDDFSLTQDRLAVYTIGSSFCTIFYTYLI